MLSSVELDALIDSVTANESKFAIVRPYDSEGAWLWSQWSGSLLQLTWKKMILLAAVAAVNCVAVGTALHATWPLFAMPGPMLNGQLASEPLVARLESLSTVWEYQLTLCTFVVTFFLNQAWTFRSRLYETLRTVQGCSQDVCLLASVHAQRDSSSSQGSRYTATSETLIADLGRYVRLAHVFFWSSRSGTTAYIVSQNQAERRTDQVARYGDLLSPAGLNRLVERGELSQHELDTLRGTALAESEYCYALLEWIGLQLVEAHEAGLLRGGAGFEMKMLEKLTSLRGAYFAIGDALDFRMSLAYVQFVQTLTDVLVFLAPFALYPKVGAWSIPLSALLTYFYCGLLELSKSFFDSTLARE